MLFIDKYNNKYEIKSIINEEYLIEHSNLLIKDTPHKYFNEIKYLANCCINSNCNYSFNLYKNNKLISFIYGYYDYSVYTVNLFWFNNIKNSFIFLSLLNKYYLDTLIKIEIYRPYKEAKWYLFDNFFNNTNHINYIKDIKINNNTINKANNLLDLYKVKLWDNMEKHN